MNDWVCIEDTGNDNDPAWAGLECVEDVMDDWECDYDPIPPPVNPSSPPTGGSGTVVSTVAAGGSPPPPVATGPVTGSGGNIINPSGATPMAGRSAAAGVVVAVAAVAISM
ncbi:hypothetical protein HDU67_002655, partial [Dinochytrium kinnereticum]